MDDWQLGVNIGWEGPSSARSGPSWPQGGPMRAPGIILQDSVIVGRHFLGPYWAHLGLSWALLGPSRGFREGILRQMLGLEGLILGCMVKKAEMSNTLKNQKNIIVFG